MYGIATFGRGPSGLGIEVVSEYKWSQGQVFEIRDRKPHP
jgi:hypothetical protein